MSAKSAAFLTSQTMGSAVRIAGLPKSTHKLFKRALAVSGAGSQSRWLSTQIRKFIREQQEKCGDDLFKVLTVEEQDIISIIQSGAAEIQQITEESLLHEQRVRQLLADLVERGILETRKKGGKTAVARGAVIDLYFVVEKYPSRYD